MGEAMGAANDIHAFAVSVLRLGRGLRAVRQPGPRRPEATLELYEFEACPYCRKVREVMSELDLAFISRACPRGARRNRARAREIGGKEQFPLLVDPNTRATLYESEVIITYLAETYGRGRPRVGRLLSPLNTAGAMAASLSRRRGGRIRPGLEGRAQPPRLIELYGFEASPYCRKVRETLHELGLDHLALNVAKRSPRRPELVARGGRMMVPFLVDPNTGVALYESDDIIAHLRQTYG